MEKKIDVIFLGTRGGLIEGNLTAYLLAPKGSDAFVCIDAGTLLSGLKRASTRGSFDHINIPPDTPLTVEGYVLKECIKAYLLSHAHMDHIMGLAVNSMYDSQKSIIGLPKTIDYLRDHIFNGISWPNLTNEGAEPCQNKYRYVRLELNKETMLSEVPLGIIPFKISHSNPYESTAFLIRFDNAYILFIGDTGPDPVEKSDKLQIIWAYITPLVRAKMLRGIFIETSYSDGRPDHLLFGHLTPSWMMYELERLAKFVDPKYPDRALAGLPVVVTSIKPTLDKISTKALISRQLREQNNLSIEFVLPEQGELVDF